MIRLYYRSQIFQVGCKTLQGIGKSIPFKSVTLNREQSVIVEGSGDKNTSTKTWSTEKKWYLEQFH